MSEVCKDYPRIRTWKSSREIWDASTAARKFEVGTRDADGDAAEADGEAEAGRAPERRRADWAPSSPVVVAR